MSMNFEMIATLKAIKDNEKFHPFDVKDFNSGWQITRYRFNAISGTNRFMLEIGGGKWNDDSKNKILTFAKTKTNNKYDRLEIAWSDRKNPEIIDKVAGFKIFTCNLLSLEEQKELKESGQEETVKKKNHNFLDATDFAIYVKKVIDSGKYDDKKFKILGVVDFQYDKKKDIYYRTLSVNKIYRVSDETPCKSVATLDTFYNDEAIDNTMFDENQKYIFNCYTDYYFSNMKQNFFVPLTLIIKGGDEKANKLANAFYNKLTKFDDESTVRKCGFVIDMIDGAEEQTITVEDLDEETQENIMLGLISEEEAIAGVGGKMMGDRITEYRIKSLSRTSGSGSEGTIYSIEDLIKKPVVTEATHNTDIDGETEDLFGDDELDDDDI